MNRLKGIGIGALLGLLILGVLFALRGCDKKQVGEITNGQLRSAEREAIIIDPNTKEVTTLKRNIDKEGKSWTSKETIEGAREVRISLDAKGNATVFAKTKGFELRPGFSLGVAETYRMGLDVEWAYWKNWGVLTGVSTNIYKTAPKLSVYGGVDWWLPWNVTRNTSFFISYDTRKNIFAGIRIEL